MAFDFKKAFDHLDKIPYYMLTYQHFVEANGIAGNPFPAASLKAMWDKCAEAGADQAPLLKEMFRAKAQGE